MRYSLLRLLAVVIVFVFSTCASGSGIFQEEKKTDLRFAESVPSLPDSRPVPAGESPVSAAEKGSVSENTGQAAGTEASVQKSVLSPEKIQEKNNSISGTDGSVPLSPARQEKAGETGSLTDGSGSVTIPVKPAEPEQDAEDKQNSGLDKYFVDINKYSTEGGKFQKKYMSSLKETVRSLLDKNFSVEEKSTGFYYEKKTGNRNMLYAGTDILLPEPAGKNYAARARSAVWKNLRTVVNIFAANDECFAEQKIKGMVIGFKWQSGSSPEQINVWILETDLKSFMDDRMTFDELVQKSTLTSASGRIVVFR